MKKKKKGNKKKKNSSVKSIWKEKHYRCGEKKEELNNGSVKSRFKKKVEFKRKIRNVEQCILLSEDIFPLLYSEVSTFITMSF